ncbi:MAG: adenylate/guanylate cyclase domain-containing protein [Candidatus Korobacteraceae bacterium]
MGGLKDTLATLIEATLRLTGAERGFVFLRDKSGGLSLAAGRNSQGFELCDDRTISHSVLDRAVNSGAEFVIADAYQSTEFANQSSVVAQELRTLICIPLLRKLGVTNAPAVTGALYLDSRVASGALTGISHNLLGTIASQAATLVENAQLAEAEQQLSRLKRFVSPKVGEMILAGEVDDPLKTHRRDITVVYTDLRGFTAFTETAEPEEVMEVLREYHETLGRIVMSYDGTVEHFAGDGVMILFNDPVPVAQHELIAVRMALVLRDAAGVLDLEWKKRGHELGFGVGVANGYATMGTIGFEGRRDYGAIGPVCSLAARLCAEAKAGQVLVPQRVYFKIEQSMRTEPMGDFSLKGFHRPVPVYNVVAALRESKAGESVSGQRQA